MAGMGMVETAPARTPASPVPTRVVLGDDEYSRLSLMVERRFGIMLGPQKKLLVENRLQQLLKENGYPSFAAYWQAELADPSGAALGELADRITTNFTYFYREPDHFELLARRVLPELTSRIAAGRPGGSGRDLRVWCAAASTGEEPYTLAILLREWFGAEYASWQAGLLATDLSDRALAKARAGVYPIESLEKLPERWRRWFRPAGNGTCRVDPVLAGDVTFRRFNLMNERFPFRRPFHVIFCRNALIYFGDEERRALAGRFHDALEPGGYLFIGHSETFGRDGALEYVHPAVYRRPL